MSFLDELEKHLAKIGESSDASGPLHVLNLAKTMDAYHFLATHGPRLLAAVRLADFATQGNHRRFILNQDDARVAAYRATVVSETGNIDRGGV